MRRRSIIDKQKEKKPLGSSFYMYGQGSVFAPYMEIEFIDISECVSV